MAIPTFEPRVIPTLADLIERIGSVPLERIPSRPAPGSATEADVLARPYGEKRLYELVDGTLVEKPMGYYESMLAGILIHFLRLYLAEHNLGIVLGEAGPLRFAPGLVRVPDVSFVAWTHFPGRMLPAEAILEVAPDLAVEVISPGNTPREMERKLGEYFAAGCRLVWYVYPDSKTVRVYTSEASFNVVGEDGILDGGDALPGFTVSVREWFAAAGERRQN
jgi:Uma2 family endonuclease